MGAFLLCWLPFFTWYLTVAICGDTYCPCPDVVVSILFWIGYFNSTLNPVIYVMTNRDFKDAFTEILRKIFCCCCPNKGCAGGGSGPGAEYHSTNVDYVWQLARRRLTLNDLQLNCCQVHEEGPWTERENLNPEKSSSYSMRFDLTLLRPIIAVYCLEALF